MAWDLTGVRRGTLDEQGCDGLKVQTYGEPGRHGPRARNLPLGLGRQRYADSGHVNDRDNGIFQVTAPIFFRVEADQKRVTDFRTLESVITYDTIICPCVKCSTLSNRYPTGILR